MHIYEQYIVELETHYNCNSVFQLYCKRVDGWMVVS